MCVVVFYIIKGVVVCYLGDGSFVMRVYAYLERFGYINFGVFKRFKLFLGNIVF